MATEPDLNALEGLTFNSTSTYTLLEELGRGGMGIVFLAEKHCEGVTDEVVLKTIKTLDRAHEERLRGEANIATRLRHENIVKTYGLESVPFHDLPETFRREIDGLAYGHPASARRAPRRISAVRRPGSGLRSVRRMLQARSGGPGHPPRDDRRLYLIVMDYIEGTDLGDLSREHLQKRLLLPVPQAAFIVSRMCRALAYAHETIVHRDISPENILINTQGVCKLSDFGIAVGAGEPIKVFAGKLGYMSPEQLDNRPLDARADIYSLGLVAYQILTGVLPFHAPANLPAQEQASLIRAQHARGLPPPDRVRPDIPETLSRIVQRMIDPDPSGRYPRIAEAGNDLEQKFLYAAGFGPTNNSLQCYLEIFENDFQQASQDQLRQLRFLESEHGKIRLQRHARPEDYSPDGLDLIGRRKGTLLHAVLTAKS